MIREINGKEYNFRMTRKGIRAAEKSGFKLSDFGNAPMSMAYELWYAALYAEHPMPHGKCDELLDDYLDSESCPESFSDVMEWLSEAYNEVFE